MDEPAFQHRPSQGSVFAGEFDQLFEEAEGGEADSVVALVHNPSGHILAVGRRQAMNHVGRGTLVVTRGLRHRGAESLAAVPQSVPVVSQCETGARTPGTLTCCSGVSCIGWEAGIRTPITWSRAPCTGSRRLSCVRFLSGSRRQHSRGLSFVLVGSCAVCLIVSQGRVRHSPSRLPHQGVTLRVEAGDDTDAIQACASSMSSTAAARTTKSGSAGTHRGVRGPSSLTPRWVRGRRTRVPVPSARAGLQGPPAD